MDYKMMWMKLRKILSDLNLNDDFADYELSAVFRKMNDLELEEYRKDMEE